MSTLSAANAEQAKAVIIVDGEYQTQYPQNTQSLQRIEAALAEFPDQMSK